MAKKNHNERKPYAIRFPKDRSLGSLYTIDPNEDRYYWIAWNNGWDFLGEARGEVVVPAGKALGFQPATDFSDTDMVHLRKMPLLFRLAFGSGIFQVIRQNAITSAGFSEIRTLTGLDSLTLDVSSINEDTLGTLQDLPNLRHVDFGTGFGQGGLGITNKGVAYVSHLTKLRTLYLDHTRVTGQGLAYLAPLTELIALRLGQTRIDDEALVHLHPLKGLQELLLHQTDVTDAGLKMLAPLKDLRSLDLGYTSITDAGLANLRPLRQLRSLNLQGMAIEGHGLSSLDALTDLSHIDLGRTGITDEQLDDIPTLPNLSSLSMSWAQITDAGLLSLRRFPKLTYLYLKDTELSEYAVITMLEHFPGIYIHQSWP